MKKFLTRLLFYLIPLPVYLGIIFLIDPFNYIGSSKMFSDDVKISISRKLNPLLWKQIEYDHSLSSRIILGDSRSANIKAVHINELTGKDYYNFAYPGGTLVDIMETFWYAESKVKLKEVYIGVNFNLYNDFEMKNNVKQSKPLLKSFFTYAFSKTVLESTIKLINKQYFTKDLAIGMPDMEYDEFWNYSLKETGKRFYGKYKYPESHYKELVRISNFCRSNNIKLVFFIPPNHTDWQHKIVEYHLENENKAFINDMQKLGELVNLNIENNFTRNRANYRDPMHTLDDSLLVSTLWGN
jgi:hypothetical protein